MAGRKGTILILVLAVLVLLSLLATVSASLQALARLESIRYMEVLESRWAVEWTHYAEEYDKKTLEPVMYDYGAYAEPGPDQGPEELRQRKDGMVKVRFQAGKLTNTGMAGGRWIDVAEKYTPCSPLIEVKEGEVLKYSVAFELAGAEPGKTTLLATPVFDDITIFYSEGVRIVSYAEQA